MSDFEDDAIIKESLNSTYCKHHFGLWSHECGCEIIPRKRKLKMLNEDLKQEIDRLKAENEKLKQSLSFYMSELAEAQKRVDELGERVYHITGSYE